MAADFDMPATGTWEQRGGWVVGALCRDFSLAREQAAGIVGNLGFESRGFTAFHEDGQPEGKGGYGWAQWTADRRRAYFAWCEEHNLEPRSDAANYGYLCEELRGTYRRTIAAVRERTSVEESVWSVGQTYERPGGTTPAHLPGYEGRLSYARRALELEAARILYLTAPPMTGSDVTELQRLLDEHAAPCDVDGSFGPQTRDAVMTFQRRHAALRADAICGPATWAALRAVA